MSSKQNSEQPPRVRRYVVKWFILFLGTMLIVAPIPFLIMALPQAGVALSETDALWLTNSILGVVTGLNLLLILCSSSKDIRAHGRLSRFFYPAIKHGKKLASVGLMGSLLYACSWIFIQLQLLVGLAQTLSSWLPLPAICSLFISMILMIRGLAIQALQPPPIKKSEDGEHASGPAEDDFPSGAQFGPESENSELHRNGSSPNPGTSATDIDDDNIPTGPVGGIPPVPENPPTKRTGLFGGRRK